MLQKRRQTLIEEKERKVGYLFKLSYTNVKTMFFIAQLYDKPASKQCSTLFSGSYFSYGIQFNASLLKRLRSNLKNSLPMTQLSKDPSLIGCWEPSYLVSKTSFFFPPTEKRKNTPGTRSGGNSVLDSLPTINKCMFKNISAERELEAPLLTVTGPTGRETETRGGRKTGTRKKCSEEDFHCGTAAPQESR